MQIEVYADILFLINFLMVFFIFWCVNKLNKPKVKIFKLVLTALFSSFSYCILILFINYNNFLNIAGSFLIILSSIFLCFKPKSLKDFFKLIFLVNLCSLFVGGLSFYLFYFKTNMLNLVSSNLYFSLKSFPLKLLIFSVFLSYILIKVYLYWYKKVFVKNQAFYNIKVYKNGENISLKALLDTGNSLKDPLTKKDVLVAEFSKIKKILPLPLKNIFYENKQNDISKIVNELKEIDFRLIPFSSIGKENGFLLGIDVDKIEIDCEDILVLKNVVVAICSFNLSKDGFYNSLLSPEMIKN